MIGKTIKKIPKISFLFKENCISERVEEIVAKSSSKEKSAISKLRPKILDIVIFALEPRADRLLIALKTRTAMKKKKAELNSNLEIENRSFRATNVTAKGMLAQYTNRECTLNLVASVNDTMLAVVIAK